MISDKVNNKKLSHIKDTTFPEKSGLPSEFAEQIGLLYTGTVTKTHKKSNGQFFTPIAIANLMASFSKLKKESYKILDPGAGTGVLSCSLIEYVCKGSNVKKIELVAYETDSTLIPYCKEVFEYAKVWLKEQGTEFTYNLLNLDFVIDNIDAFEDTELLVRKEIELFDLVISNPPYFKLQKTDIRSKAAQCILSGQTNIYSVFMALSAKLLNPGGELIFITPRSFTSGNYFRAFRKFIFNLMQLENVHLFISRKDTFNRDNVLQETMVLKARKVSKIKRQEKVVVSSSFGLKDLTKPARKSYLLEEILDIDTTDMMLHLPINDTEENILNIFKGWSGSLNKYGYQISTGPVVSFRARSFLRKSVENEEQDYAPLLWLHNVQKMIVEWPIGNINKEQYIVSNTETRPLLIPNKNYILLRRFSSKDDKSRLIAAPYLCNFIQYKFIGVENKVNYIYKPKGHLDRNEVIGLCALLNSSLFDMYFRIFNGNVNVSATELRAMTLPPIATLKGIGDDIILSNDFSIANTNQIVNNHLRINKLFGENEKS